MYISLGICIYTSRNRYIYAVYITILYFLEKKVLQYYRKNGWNSKSYVYVYVQFELYYYYIILYHIYNMIANMDAKK